METVFRVNISSLDKSFLSMLKALFKKREVEITVADIPSDETALLLNDPGYKAHLLEAIEEIKHNKNLTRFTGEEFEKYNKELTQK